MNNSTASSLLAKNETVGWVSSDNSRGTFDILWSSGITIVLCVWVSTYPNVPAPTDRWYNKATEKFNLACIGLLGPDILMGIAGGQLSSARRNVKKFNRLPGVSWELIHGFFADMGALHVVSPDYPDGFPVNGEQLYYLVHHGFVAMPAITATEIRAMSNFDPLSKLITLSQMLWYTLTVSARLRQGYNITTLELTTLTFAIVMLVTSAMWFHKPQVSTVTYLHTRNLCSMESVRDFARHETHPSLPVKWYRTPMDFASPRPFMDKHWAYYADLSLRIKVPLFHRAIKPQWDRIPSDRWYPVEGWLLSLALIVQIPFCFAFLAAWNFHFPSRTEQIMWRTASVFHASYSSLLTAYYIFKFFHRETEKPAEEMARLSFATTSDQAIQPFLAAHYPAIKAPQSRLKRWANSLQSRLQQWGNSLRNLSLDQDPEMIMSLRWTMVPFFFTLLYGFCRLFFYVEDVISLRAQPADVYAPVHNTFRLFSTG